MLLHHGHREAEVVRGERGDEKVAGISVHLPVFSRHQQPRTGQTAHRPSQKSSGSLVVIVVSLPEH